MTDYTYYCSLFLIQSPIYCQHHSQSYACSSSFHHHHHRFPWKTLEPVNECCFYPGLAEWRVIPFFLSCFWWQWNPMIYGHLVTTLVNPKNHNPWFKELCSNHCGLCWLSDALCGECCLAWPGQYSVSSRYWVNVLPHSVLLAPHMHSLMGRLPAQQGLRQRIIPIQ